MSANSAALAAELTHRAILGALLALPDDAAAQFLQAFIAHIRATATQAGTLSDDLDQAMVPRVLAVCAALDRRA
jgi:hypothetical protein